MKHILRFVLAAFICSMAVLPSQAQLANGSTAPDFTMTDLDGVEHNLYSYLDQGMSVILDFSAVWCGPCWSYHQSGVLEEIYTLHGPETGDGTIMVFFIEADQGTIAQLNGGAGSTGDWVTGTDYPILTTLFPNPASVAQDYAIAYFPTMYTVCPSREITETGQISADAHVEFTQLNCAAQVGVNNAAAQAYLGSDNYCGSFTPSFRLMNLGSDPLTSAEMELHVNGVMTEDLSWTGNLATYNLEDISWSPISGAGDVEVEMIITSTNGGSDDDASDDVYAKTVLAAPGIESMDVLIEGTTDGYGDEVYWAILDDAGTIVAEGGNPNVGLTNIGTGTYPPPSDPNMYGNNQAFTHTVTLPAQTCYDVIVTDYYGDGMSLWGTNAAAFFRVSDPSNSVELHYVAGDSYANSEEVPVDANDQTAMAPQANFSYTTADLEVSVTDASTGADTWSWDYGDGNTAMGQNPGPYTYAAAGTYDLCLTVTNAAGTNTTCESVTVSAAQAAPQANFTYTLSGLALSVTDNSTGADMWAWDFGDTNTSDQQTPGVHTYATSGLYSVCLTVTNSAGSDQQCQTVSATGTGVEDIASLEAISVYPNPATDAAAISLSFTSTTEVTVELTNTVGQVLYSESAVYTSGTETITLNTSELAEGTYFVNVRTEDGLATEKLVVTK